MDRKLLRNILDVPEGTPNELLYLETGCIPLNEIIKCRRINYLHDLLTRNENELVVRFYKAQLRNPSKGDWTEIVKEDLIDFKIEETFDQLSKISKKVFKKKISAACRQFSFEKLMNKKGSKSKTLTHSELKTASYFTSQIFNSKECKFLFKIRARMLQVKDNFKQQYKNDMNSLTKMP